MYVTNNFLYVNQNIWQTSLLYTKQQKKREFFEKNIFNTNYFIITTILSLQQA